MLFGDTTTPPRSGRYSSSSTSPDSLYKSMDSSRGLNFSSPDSEKYCKLIETTKKTFPSLPKINFDDDSDEHDWNAGSRISSPLSRPPALRKVNRARSRLVKSGSFSPVHPLQEKENFSMSPVATPPHKRLRALQIADGIRSPLRSPASPMRRKFSPRAALFGSTRKPPRDSPLRTSTAKKPSINPFTPPCNYQIHSLCGSVALKSSSDSGCGTDDSWLLDLPKPSSPAPREEWLPLRELYTARYKEEFVEESILGTGEFGTVFKCVNKLDGCTYAIKRSRHPVAGSIYEKVARNEVYAHAVLGKHSHLVRYYSAWAESDHLYIQNEYCNGGSLAEEISNHKKRNTRFTETDLKDILKQVAHGLKYIHAQQLAHMDIKPGNIFLQYNPQILHSPESGIEEDSSDSELNDRVTYKIGDFGHVVSLHAAAEIEEGDCRYMAREILTDKHRYICKADVFSLGLSIYQATALVDLPKNGEEWHQIRDGHLPEVSEYSKTFNNILQTMVHPNPKERPAASSIYSHPELCPAERWSRKQLAWQLDQERRRNELLTRQLAAVQESAELKNFGKLVLPDSLCQNVPRASGSRSSRLLGIKVNRSKSLTNFS